MTKKTQAHLPKPQGPPTSFWLLPKLILAEATARVPQFLQGHLRDLLESLAPENLSWGHTSRMSFHRTQNPLARGKI